MEIRQSVLGEVAIHSGAQVSGVDLATLLRRLLLFDSVVIRSVRLREVRTLIRAFGQAGFLQLLNSGVLKMCFEVQMVITDVAHNGVRQQPLAHFTFGFGEISDRLGILKSELRCLQGIPGLKNAERAAMEETIINGLVRPPNDYGSQIVAQIDLDLRNNSPALRAAITTQLKVCLGESAPQAFDLRVEETEKRVFRVVTNLAPSFGHSEQTLHEKILQPAIGAVANINQRIAEMCAYSSITGFSETDAPLLFGKLAGIIVPQNPQPLEEQFARVVTIANLPDLASSGRIDVDKLLKARESSECREFRAWLSKLENVSDKEVADMVASIRDKIGFMVRSDVGKVLRLAATTAVGLIPGAGLVLGPAAGAVDSFLVERLLPTSGVFAFLAKAYPSLFVSP